MAVVKGYLRDEGMQRLVVNAFTGSGEKLNLVGFPGNTLDDRVQLNWTYTVGSSMIYTSNSISSGNEMLFKVPRNTNLPNLNILLSVAGFPVGATFVLEGNGTSVAQDQAFLYTRITLTFPYATSDV